MEHTHQTAKDIMNTSIVFVDGLATVYEAVALLKKNQTDVLIISKRNEQDAFGILTSKDVVTKVLMLDLDIKETNVYEIMSKPVISVPATMNVRYIPRFFKRAGIQVAPVEENGEIIGYISYQSML
ncbi:CBS domain-containing protein [Mongoliitalea lutea]|uniref:CBS domain-containing protein n=1 Tax=Mongoliitalea lutea TaxID=849756 RepID=A0A8J3D228_9BACT|nr:CBS domain-containing protein [Mongoliitalea lutea]GHB48659.1 CBS domain-containing protein [Mongoliitalea lutea]